MKIHHSSSNIGMSQILAQGLNVHAHFPKHGWHSNDEVYVQLRVSLTRLFFVRPALPVGWQRKICDNPLFDH